MKLDDFNNIDLKSVGSLPLSVKSGIAGLSRLGNCRCWLLVYVESCHR